MISAIKNIAWSKIVIFLYCIVAVLGLLIDYDAFSQEIHISNIYEKPFQKWVYLLGSDGLGRNVLWGLMNGAKVSFFIATLSALGTLIVASIFGYLSGYLGNDKVKLNPITILLILVSMFLFVFYLQFSTLNFYLLSFTFFLLLYIFIKRDVSIGGKKYNIPLDSIIRKLIEIFRSVPGMFLIIFLLSLFSERSIFNLIFIIILFRWPRMTRIIRAEILKIRENDYIVAAQSLGISHFDLLKSHILPNIQEPIKVSLIYGFISSILIESSLTFIGLGLPLETVSWGSMLSESRVYLPAWWLVVFPGILMFLVISALKALTKTKHYTFSG